MFYGENIKGKIFFEADVLYSNVGEDCFFLTKISDLLDPTLYNDDSRLGKNLLKYYLGPLTIIGVIVNSMLHSPVSVKICKPNLISLSTKKFLNEVDVAENVTEFTLYKNIPQPFLQIPYDGYQGRRMLP